MDNAAAAAAADDGVVVAPGDPFKTKAAELAAAFDAETEVLVQGHIEGWTAQCENEADEMLGVTKQHRRRLYGEAARYVQMLSMVRGQRNLDFKPSQYTVPLEAARLDLLFKEAIQYTQSRKWGRTTAHIPPPTVVLMLLVMIGKARFHNNPLLPTPDYSAFMLKISRTPEYPLLLDLFGGKAKNFQTYVSSFVRDLDNWGCPAKSLVPRTRKTRCDKGVARGPTAKKHRAEAVAVPGAVEEETEEAGEEAEDGFEAGEGGDEECSPDDMAAALAAGLE